MKKITLVVLFILAILTIAGNQVSADDKLTWNGTIVVDVSEEIPQVAFETVEMPGIFFPMQTTILANFSKVLWRFVFPDNVSNSIIVTILIDGEMYDTRFDFEDFSNPFIEILGHSISFQFRLDDGLDPSYQHYGDHCLFDLAEVQGNVLIFKARIIES